MAQLDKFGNEQVVIGLKDKNGSGYAKGFFEIGNNLFKVTTSPSNKEGVIEWVTLTKMRKQRSQASGFGQNNSYPQKRGF